MHEGGLLPTHEDVCAGYNLPGGNVIGESKPVHTRGHWHEY